MLVDAPKAFYCFAAPGCQSEKAEQLKPLRATRTKKMCRRFAFFLAIGFFTFAEEADLNGSTACFHRHCHILA